MPRCEDPSWPTQCFVLGGTVLTIYGDGPLDKTVLTKITD
jgi:hypothetical protein